MTSLYLKDNLESLDTPCRCDNCDWRGPASDLDVIEDAQERLDPGCEVPVGACPDCGMLAYLWAPKKAVSDRPTLAAISALNAARAFFAGFEGDQLQDGIPAMLAQIDRAISAAPVYLAIHVEGGCVQGVSSNDPAALEGVAVILLDFDNEGEPVEGSFSLQYHDGEPATICGGPLSVDLSAVDLPSTWANAEKAGGQGAGDND